MTTTQTRPKTIPEMQALLKREQLRSEAARQYALSFKPQRNDVFIATFSKSGTTWLQQIVHGLRTRGDMDFDDISRVIPWMDVCYLQGIDLNAPQRAAPRAFKSHFTWDDIPKGGRYLLSVRDPNDALVSMFHFFEGWFFEKGEISIATYAREHFMVHRNYWRHLASWWPQRHQSDVLLLSYEDMLLDLPSIIGRIAQFIGCDLDDELLEIVIRQSSLDFMRDNGDKFNDQMVREMLSDIFPPGNKIRKIRTGRVGGHREELPADICWEMDQIWKAEITNRFGLTSYRMLRTVLAEETG